nr:MAG: hypothetical protein KatS3mg041_1004 [Bacteroidota bacterium]
MRRFLLSLLGAGAVFFWDLSQALAQANIQPRVMHQVLRPL